MLTRVFWLAAVERAVKTAAQTALVTLGADRVDAFDADWRLVAGMALGGAVLSVLSSLASTQVGDPDDPSALR